ncbi:MAG: aldehyde ferredoxin oxidoreductase C-terminal domain-containing protein, partial [Chloroflexota bacterium]
HKRWYTFGEMGVLATKNMLSPDLGIAIGRRFSDACKTYIKVTGVPCFSCPSACSYKAEVTEGNRKGFVATMGGGGENMEGAAAMVAVSDPADILWLTDLYDRMGINAPTLGCAVALAFECFERGLLTVEDTDGLELRWGNAEAAAALVRQAANRKGFGAILADGPKKAAERIGGDAAKYAVWVKGAGFRLHDYRGRYESMLAQVLAGAGPRGEGTGMTGAYDPDLGYTKSPDDPMLIPPIYRRIQSKRLFEDSIGVCMFNASTITGIMSLEGRALATAIGWDEILPEEQLAIGERIINMERVFNVARGLTPKDDMDLSPRVLEPPTEGVFNGRTI